MVFGGFLGISKHGFRRIFRNIQALFFGGFKGCPRMVFAAFLGMSKHSFWRIFRDIQAWCLENF